MNFTLKKTLNKVPEVTLYFWIIKILCTTIGETIADFLNVSLNLGLSGVSVVIGIALALALVFQLRAKQYIPSLYWLTVALVSVFGTLVTDILTDKIGLPLETSTIIFSVLLTFTFLIWYLKEKTLSIHSIFTRQREVFYWLAIFFTFALGTASGDLMAEGLGFGYLVTGLIVAGVIAMTSIAWRLRLNSVLSFWIIYIMTRPLGASIGDYLSQPSNHGGLGLGSTVTSIIFVSGILVIITYLSITKRDVTMSVESQKESELKENKGLLHTVIVVLTFLIVGVTGYAIRHSAIQTSITDTTNTKQINMSNTQASQLGELTLFKTITQDTLDTLNANDQTGATKRIRDLEYEWDNAAARLKSKDRTVWTKIDGKIDTVLRELRSTNPNIVSEKSALEALLMVLNS